MTKSCEGCKYCVVQDEGYSNYTVEGSTLYCLHHLNPGFPTDHVWGLNPALAFAEHCPQFAEGEGPQIDVEQERDLEQYSQDPEVKALLRLFDRR
jgi:hypothetical protein